METRKYHCLFAKNQLLFTGLLLCTLIRLNAQEEKKYVREGNKAYGAGKYKEAEDQYQKAVGINPNSSKGVFNLGDAYYKEGKNKEAAGKFEELTKTFAGNDALCAQAWHNLGNAHLQDKKYEDAIAAYKKALTLNPKDEDTRYNLTYAQQMLKQQQNKDKQDKKNNKDKKDKDKDKKDNKDQKDKDKKNDKDKKDDKGNKDKDKKNENKQSQPEQNQVSKDAAKKMLNEMNNNERKVQAKLKKQKEQGQPVKIEKDW